MLAAIGGLFFSHPSRVFSLSFDMESSEQASNDAPSLEHSVQTLREDVVGVAKHCDGHIDAVLRPPTGERCRFSPGERFSFIDLPRLLLWSDLVFILLLAGADGSAAVQREYSVFLLHGLLQRACLTRP